MPVALIAAFIGILVLTAKSREIDQSRLVQVACTVYDMDGNLVLKTPGGRCLYLEDGRFVAGDSKSLVFYDRLSVPVWRLPMHTHHILTRTESGDFLVGTSEVRIVEGTPVRFDVLLRIDPSGQIKNSFHFADYRQELEPTSLAEMGNFDWDSESTVEAKREFTHMNSYYEIPRNSAESQFPAFEKGNIIVNSIGPGRVLVLSPDLKKILWRLDQRTIAGSDHFHDVQVLPNGRILMYENIQNGSPSSRLIEFDPLQNQIAWVYAANPPSEFYVEATGGVQLLEDGSLFFSDPTSADRARRIDRRGQILETVEFPSVKDVNGVRVRFQDAKLRDLRQFLKYYRPL